MPRRLGFKETKVRIYVRARTYSLSYSSTMTCTMHPNTTLQQQRQYPSDIRMHTQSRGEPAQNLPLVYFIVPCPYEVYWWVY